ncbi:MAG: hypothetical protein ACYSTS_07205 [Planctomycetota bacterium]|jgi:hypothetical protein
MNSLAKFYRIIWKNIKRFKVLVQPFCRQRIKWSCPVIHIRKLTNLPAFIALPLLCGRSKKKLRCPADLTILIIHNYEEEPIMEKSLHYVGIENFVVMKPEFEEAWRMVIKLIELKKFLDSGSCKTKYILYCDSDDAVLRDDPGKAIKFLQEEDCDLLLSNSTTWSAGYECMPEIQKWADQNARENGRRHCYINAGVFIGKTEFLREVVDLTMEYITDHDLSSEEYWGLLEDGSLCERMPEFPKGVGCDQEILRYLHPQLYPRMKIDYKDKLAIR